MPSNEPVLDEAMSLRGTLRVSANACVCFEERSRIYLPPRYTPSAGAKTIS